MSNPFDLTDELLHEALGTRGHPAPAGLQAAIAHAVAATPRRRYGRRFALPIRLQTAWLLLLLAALLASLAAIGVASGLLERRAPDPTWFSRGPLALTSLQQTEVSGHPQFLGELDGVVYVLAGQRLHRYDMRSDEWRDPISFPRDGFPRPVSAVGGIGDSAVGLDGAIYVFTAATQTLDHRGPSLRVTLPAEADGPSATPVVEAIAPWTPLATGDHVHATTVRGSDGRIYLHSWSEDGETVPRLDIYDPASDAWSASSPLPSGPDRSSLALDHSGGIWVFDTNAEEVSSAYRYDPTNDSWTTLRAELRAQLGASVTGPDGALYVLERRDDVASEMPSWLVWRVDPVTGWHANAASFPGGDAQTMVGEAYALDRAIFFVRYEVHESQTYTLTPFVLAPSQDTDP